MSKMSEKEKQSRLEKIGVGVHMSKDGNKAIVLIRCGEGYEQIELTRGNDGVKMSGSIMSRNGYIKALENLPEPYLMGGYE